MFILKELTHRSTDGMLARGCALEGEVLTKGMKAQ
jgi:hypothetical protein